MLYNFTAGPVHMQKTFCDICQNSSTFVSNFGLTKYYKMQMMEYVKCLSNYTTAPWNELVELTQINAWLGLISMSSYYIKLIQTIIKHILYQSHKGKAVLNDVSLSADSVCYQPQPSSTADSHITKLSFIDRVIVNSSNCTLYRMQDLTIDLINLYCHCYWHSLLSWPKNIQTSDIKWLN